MNTDRDYADMINPIGRMEREACARGYREGVAAGIFYAFVSLIAAGMLLVAWNAHAATWTYEESFTVIKASQRNARIVVCQDNGFERKWACRYKSEGK